MSFCFVCHGHSEDECHRCHAREKAELLAELDEAKAHHADALGHIEGLGGALAEAEESRKRAESALETERIERGTCEANANHWAREWESSQAALKRAEVESADMRVRLQRAHGILHALTLGDEREIARMVEDASRLLDETRPNPTAGVAILSELREARSELTLLRDQLRSALGQPECPDEALVEAVGAMFVELSNIRGDNEELDRLVESAREERDAARAANTPLNLEIERLRGELEKALAGTLSGEQAEEMARVLALFGHAGWAAMLREIAAAERARQKP